MVGDTGTAPRSSVGQVSQRDSAPDPRRAALGGRLDAHRHTSRAELRCHLRGDGFGTAAIEALTWRRFDGLVGTVDVAQRQMKMSWPFRRFRFCPECLANSHGRWQLEWRLPWVFACPKKHFRLLADSCPSCGQTQRTIDGWLRGDLVPALELCRATAPNGSRCGHLLSTTSTIALAEGHPFLKAQAALSDILYDATVTAGLYGTMPASTKQFLTDLRLLAMRFAEATDPRKRTVITRRIRAATSSARGTAWRYGGGAPRRIRVARCRHR